MRLLHTSDWHLGKRLMERSLLSDQQHALDQVLTLLTATPHDALVVAGDVFDQSVPPEEAVQVLGAFLARLRERLPSLPVVLIAGNHDSAARLASNAELLSLTGVHVRGDPEMVDWPVVLRAASGETAQLWAVPFLWAGTLQDGDVVARTQVEALDFALARIRARQDAGLAQVLVSHCFAQGGSTSDSERTLVGQATAVAPSRFSGFDYVALGHLHRPQLVAPNARYSGSLLAYSFSEVGDAKAVWSVEVQAGAPHAATPHALVPRRALRRLEGTLEALLESSEFQPYADDYLHITLTEARHTGQPMAALRKRFPHLLHLLNPVAQAQAKKLAARAAKAGEDVDADFLAFQQQLYGDVKPEVRAAFEALRRAGQGEDA